MPLLSLPSSFAAIIAEEAARLPLANLIAAADSLSRSYRREGGGLPRALSGEARVAYLAMRMPATYAATSAALADLQQIVDTDAISTCLDVGAGPGTASLAASHLIPVISSIRQLERDQGWSPIASRLSQSCAAKVVREIGDLRTADIAPYDLVIAAYALNELPDAERDGAITRLWGAARQTLIVVEPGTPDGFEIVRRVRERCLERGAHAAAPCTHDALCPMTREDWCHRSIRVERSELHRRLKGAQLAFEDEKFSYVVLTREPPRRRAIGRIVRRPIRAGGHVHLDLCTAHGLERTTITRADRLAYKAARDVEWGDAWPKPSDDASE
jgi:ribosomal protein RSM22 (predicted rRNA methylase)